jgi:hypothetical protein
MSPLTESTRLTLAKQSVAPLLIDAYPGAAAAYSLRNLSWAYGGPVVRVRRSSDNTEQDFTATQVTNGTLTTFCGAGNGFVRTWYDQSGNGRNANQSTSAAQPQVVSSGALVTYGTRPATSYDGSKFMATTGFSSLPAFTAVYSAIVCQQKAGATTLLGRRNADSVGGVNFQLFANGNTWNGSTYAGPALGSGNQVLLSWAFNSTTFLSRLNSLTVFTGALGLGTLANEEIAIGQQGVSRDREKYTGFISEILLYPSDQAVVMSNLESNINAHYAIY